MIREIKPTDAQQISDIYNYYVLNTSVTFEEEAVSIETMRERIVEIIKTHPWFVYEKDNTIIGYAYASGWKTRCAYKYSVETTIYLQHGFSANGIGTELYKALLEQLKKTNFHAIIGGIALPNDGCIALHKKLGFEKIAHFKEVGFKFNKWIDVTYWETILKK